MTDKIDPLVEWEKEAQAFLAGHEKVSPALTPLFWYRCQEEPTCRHTESLPKLLQELQGTGLKPLLVLMSYRAYMMPRHFDRGNLDIRSEAEELKRGFQSTCEGAPILCPVKSETCAISGFVSDKELYVLCENAEGTRTWPGYFLLVD
jgi:hypothetical protein